MKMAALMGPRRLLKDLWRVIGSIRHTDSYMMRMESDELFMSLWCYSDHGETPAAAAAPPPPPMPVESGVGGWEGGSALKRLHQISVGLQ